MSLNRGRAFMLACLLVPLLSANAMGSTEFFTDRAAWAAAQSTVQSFRLTAENVAQAQEVTTLPSGGQNLGPTLTFLSSNTGLGADFTLQTIQPAYDFVFWTAHGQAPILAMGDPPGPALTDDDWEAMFSGPMPLLAFGAEVGDAEPGTTAGETFCAYDSDDVLLGCISPPEPTSGKFFVGVVSSEPLGRVSFDEDTGPDNIGLLELFFGERSDCNNNGIDDNLELAGQFGLAPKFDYATQDYPTQITSADLDSDGDVDVAVSNEFSSTVSVFWNSGVGEFPERTDYFVGSHPADVEAADLNLDGHIDLAVVIAYENKVVVLINDGAGSFYAPVAYPTGSLPSGMAIANLNEDAWPDVVVANRSEDTISVLMNNGDGTFGAGVPWPVGDLPAKVVAADLDADGDLDLVVANHYAASLSVLWNNYGTFGDRMDHSVAHGPAGIVAADLDGDGAIDVAVACQSSVVSVLLNQGAGILGSASNWSVGSMSTGMTGADFDRDGDIDLVTANYAGANVSILLNDGSANFAHLTHGAGAGAYFVTSADLDGDGDDDLVVTNVLADSISVLMNVSIAAGQDCNENGIPDECDIADCTGASSCDDCNLDGVPDGCEADCDGDGLIDDCDPDIDDDGVLNEDDVCDYTPVDALVEPDGSLLGDVDGDCDVDLVDFSVLQLRHTGPGCGG